MNYTNAWQLINSSPLMIAHRAEEIAYSIGIKEFLLLLKNYRIDAVEIDVSGTKDNKILVIHSNTDKERLIKNLTLSDIKDKKYPYIMFEEFASNAFKDYFYVLDIKSRDLSKDILRIANSTWLYERIIISFREKFLSEYREITSRIPSTIKVDRLDMRVIKIAKHNKIPAVSVHYNDLNKDKIEKAHKEGIKVFAWIVNNPRVAEGLLKDNVDGIISDNVEIISQIVERHKFLKKLANSP